MRESGCRPSGPGRSASVGFNPPPVVRQAHPKASDAEREFEFLSADLDLNRDPITWEACYFRASLDPEPMTGGWKLHARGGHAPPSPLGLP